MNDLLTYKCFLLSNIGTQLDIPTDIHKYIMSMLYDFTHPNVYLSENKIIIIVNRKIYHKDDSWKLLNIRIDNIKYYHVKKLVYGECFALLLCYNGDLYLCCYNNNEISKLTRIVTNIKDVFCRYYKFYYITNDNKLYGQMIKLDINKGIFGLNPNFMIANLNIDNYKEFIHQSGKFLILFNDGKLVIYYNDRQQIDHSLPPIKNVALCYTYMAAVTFDNKILLLNCDHNQPLNVDYTIGNIDDIKMVTSWCNNLFILTYKGELYRYSSNRHLNGSKSVEDILKNGKITKIEIATLDSIYSINSQMIAVAPDGTLYETCKLLLDENPSDDIFLLNISL